MENKSYIFRQDGSIHIQQLTSEYLEDAVEMMVEAFFRYENVCKAVGVAEDAEAIEELKQLTRATAKDGVTVIAVDKETNKVVGAAFNKLQVKDTHGEPPFFDSFQNSCKNSRAKEVLRLMTEVDGFCDLFDLCQVDCLLEIMFLGTLPQYRGKGIAKKLCEASIEVGRKLLNGVNVKVSVDGQELSLEPVPKVATAIYTSFITQKIGKSLGFQVAAEKSYDLFEFEGKTFSSVIGEETPSLTLEYRKID